MFVEYWLVFSSLFMLLLAAGVGYCLKRSEADWGSWPLNALEGFNRIFCYYYHRQPRIKIPLPERGGAIVAANHLSGLDPLLLLAASKRPLRFLIAQEQYQRFGFTWLYRLAGCIPVDRNGRSERAFRVALDALQKGEVIAIFPQGGIHLPGHLPGKLKSGVARLSYLSGAPVYPVNISGVSKPDTIFLCLLKRSRIALHNHPPELCQRDQVDDFLGRLKVLIEG